MSDSDPLECLASLRQQGHKLADSLMDEVRAPVAPARIERIQALLDRAFESVGREFGVPRSQLRVVVELRDRTSGAYDLFISVVYQGENVSLVEVYKNETIPWEVRWFVASFCSCLRK